MADNGITPEKDPLRENAALEVLLDTQEQLENNSVSHL